MVKRDLTFRPLDEHDCQQFLTLYEAVHGIEKPVEWFTWKYVDTPEIDHIPIIGAFDDGILIGVRPLFVIPLRDRSWEGLGLEQSDAMVHPAYRRQGIFSELVTQTIERYETEENAVFFSFPNAASWGAYRKLGWQRVGPVNEGFNFHRIGSLGAERGKLPQKLARVADTIGNGFETLSRVGSPPPAGIQTDIVDGVPAKRIASLARRSQPLTIHTNRTRSFLEWRFDNPDWDYTTCIGTVNGTDTAALIVGTGVKNGIGQITRIVDIIPVTGDRLWERTIDWLLEEVRRIHATSTVFVVPADRVPKQIRRRNGFISDRTEPLHRFSAETDLVIRPVTEGSIPERLTQREAWSPTFIEYDTS